MLDSSFGDLLPLVLNFCWIIKKSKGSAQAGQMFDISFSYYTCLIQGSILPGTVAVGFLQDFNRVIKLFGALDKVYGTVLEKTLQVVGRTPSYFDQLVYISTSFM